MGKGKMSLLDVRAVVKELQSALVGLRLANVYHLNARTYLFKLSSSTSKQHLLVESGVRLHTTAYLREHDPLPNNFASKLRKHIRLLRLEDVQQLGVDRVVDLVFGRGERKFHVLLELFAQGNIVLTDGDYHIIMVLRVHQYGDAPAGAPALAEGEGKAVEEEQQQQEAKPATGEDEEEVVDDDNFTEIEKRGLAKEKLSASASAAAATASASTAPSAAGVDRVAVRSVYPYHRAQQEQAEVTRDMIQQIIAQQGVKQREEEEKLRREEEAEEEARERSQAPLEEAEADDSIAGQQQPGKRAKRKKDLAKDAAKAAKPVKARKRLKLPPLKAVLASSLHYGPDVIEHCLITAGLDAGAGLDMTNMTSQEVDRLVEAFAEAPLIMEKVEKEPLKGYIVVREEGGKDVELKKPKQKRRRKAGAEDAEADSAQPDPPSAAADQAPSQPSAAPTDAPTTTAAASSSAAAPSSASAAASSAHASGRVVVAKAEGVVEVYSEYLPLLLAQHRSPEGEYAPSQCRLVEYPSLDAAMDEFYSKAEEQREELRLLKERAAALHKIERVKQSHASQLSSLSREQEDNRRKAELLETHTAAVDAAIASINAELARGTDWRELQAIIKAEKEKRNPLALLVAGLRLEENTVTLSLSHDLAHLHPSFSYATCTPEQRPVKVDVDLSLSAFNNASQYYSAKKSKAAKQEKTSEASALAIKAAVRKTEEALKQVDVKARIQKIRKTFWWEKYHWFISSENFLVLGGHDAQQNEALVKKHLDPHDLYVHADVHGASSVIIKNPTPNAQVPPLTIQQAATMCICRSSAWKGKVQVEAYWVHAEQVSRTAPTGMFLQTGSFMIRGKKNFVTRMPMVMGLGVLFRLEDECVAAHKGERRIRGGEEEGEDEVADESKDGKKGKKATESKEDEEEEREEAEEEGEEVEGEDEKKGDGEPDDDFDVTSAMVKGLSMNARKAELSEMSSEVDSEAEREAADQGEEKKGDAPKKRMSAAEKRRLKKAQEKGAAPANFSMSTAAADNNGDKTAAAQEETPHSAADVNTADAAEAAEGSEEEHGSRSARRKKAKGKKEKTASGAVSGKGASAAAAAPAAAAPLTRGKRNKLKKLSAKYADQDEEDLLIAASVLGLQNVEMKKKEIQQREKLQQRPAASTRDDVGDGHHADDENGEVAEADKPAGRGKGSAAGSKKAAAASQTAASAEVDESDRVCFHCKQRGHVFKNCPFKTQPAASAVSAAATGSAAVTFSAARRAAQAEEAEELERLAEEENIGDPSNAASSPLGLVDTLTAIPFDDDRLQFALVTCAPYSALTSYKFKAKLLPGSQKKGKVCSAALNLWTKQPGVREVEKDMLRGMREEEIMAVLLSNTKLAAGLAGEAAKKRRPAARKAAAADD